MVFKPLDLKTYLRYIKLIGWSLKKGGIDWSLCDENGGYLCTIKIAHGKRTKQEVVAYSVHKTEKLVKEKGLTWPPKRK